MKAIQPYLNFDGNTREAMTFYHRCLGGELAMHSFADRKVEAPPGAENRIIHAQLESGSAVLLGSDTMPGQPFSMGSNFYICIVPDSVEETDSLFAALGAGGTVTMPLANTFWGAYFGMLKDRFGVCWMLNCLRTTKAGE